jgi:hypothetical protein
MYEISQKVSKYAIKLTVPVWNTIKKKKIMMNKKNRQT